MKSIWLFTLVCIGAATTPAISRADVPADERPSVAPSQLPAQGAEQAPSPSERSWDRWGTYRRAPAFEVNVLWPFFPGGLTDLKVVLPALRPDRDAWRGEVVLGLHSDFGWRVVREQNSGKVAILAAKAGYRQFLAYGVHVEVTVNAGWRQEQNNVYDGTTINGAVARLWPAAGWQYDLTPSIYFNLRGLVGVHLVRTGPYGDKERPLSGGGDMNLAVRF